MSMKILHFRINISLLRLGGLLAVLLTCFGTEGKNRRNDRVVTNPIDLAYAFTRDDKAGGREAADPMIVPFGGKYYLFATKNYGYWVSDNLCDWTFITSDVLPFHRFAPAAMAYKGELYWMGSLDNRLYKTQTPDDGNSWTLASDEICAYRDDPQRTVVDPYLFADDDQRVFLYWGSSMEEPIRGVELDPEHGFRPKGDPAVLIGHHEDVYGWECRGDRNERSEPSCSEGAAMLKHDGRYYLQYAGPGTQFDTYGDGLYVSENPLGPFTHADASPFSVKVGGWMTGAGHGTTFQDKYGNWWHVATTVIAQRYKFERRIGLWPVVFTPGGGMFALSDYADMPFVVPDRPMDWTKCPPWTGCVDLSVGKAVAASSQTQDHQASCATDFSIKTWWSATTGEEGEWICVDLGKKCTVNAIQTNFADEGFGMYESDAPVKTPYRFVLEVSANGTTWHCVSDRTDNGRGGTHRTHELIVLPRPAKARYVRLTNKARLTGKFSVYDLRIFGRSAEKAPEAVGDIRVDRKADRRRIEVSWPKSQRATGYVVRWGLSPDALFSTCQTLDNRLELGLFSTDQEYFFRVDAWGDGGITTGKKVK